MAIGTILNTCFQFCRIYLVDGIQYKVLLYWIFFFLSFLSTVPRELVMVNTGKLRPEAVRKRKCYWPGSLTGPIKKVAMAQKKSTRNLDHFALATNQHIQTNSHKS